MISRPPVTLAQLPRLVWFHWAQGFESAPIVVKHCLESWRTQNPDWKIVLLDRKNLSDWVNPDELPVDALRKTSEQVYANAVRLALLRRHGGVWADASCWCRVPLSSWLIGRPGDFFAFANPGADRVMANWFMAAMPDSYIVQTMEHEYVRIFRKYGPLKAFSQSFINEAMQRTANADIFLDPFMFERLKGYPYYLFHYLFESLCKKDPTFGKRWSDLPKMSARPSLELRHAGLATPLTDALRARWKELNPPVHKLANGDTLPPSGSVFAEVMAGRL